MQPKTVCQLPWPLTIKQVDGFSLLRDTLSDTDALRILQERLFDDSETVRLTVLRHPLVNIAQAARALPRHQPQQQRQPQRQQQQQQQPQQQKQQQQQQQQWSDPVLKEVEVEADKKGGHGQQKSTEERTTTAPRQQRSRATSKAEALRNAASSPISPHHGVSASHPGSRGVSRLGSPMPKVARSAASSPQFVSPVSRRTIDSDSVASSSSAGSTPSSRLSAPSSLPGATVIASREHLASEHQQSTSPTTTTTTSTSGTSQQQQQQQTSPACERCHVAQLHFGLDFCSRHATDPEFLDSLNSSHVSDAHNMSVGNASSNVRVSMCPGTATTTSPQALQKEEEVAWKNMVRHAGHNIADIGDQEVARDITRAMTQLALQYGEQEETRVWNFSVEQLPVPPDMVTEGARTAAGNELAMLDMSGAGEEALCAPAVRVTRRSLRRSTRPYTYSPGVSSFCERRGGRGDGSRGDVEEDAIGQALKHAGELQNPGSASPSSPTAAVPSGATTPETSMMARERLHDNFSRNVSTISLPSTDIVPSSPYDVHMRGYTPRRVRDSARLTMQAIEHRRSQLLGERLEEVLGMSPPRQGRQGRGLSASEADTHVDGSGTDASSNLAQQQQDEEGAEGEEEGAASAGKQESSAAWQRDAVSDAEAANLLCFLSELRRLRNSRQGSSRGSSTRTTDKRLSTLSVMTQGTVKDEGQEYEPVFTF